MVSRRGGDDPAVEGVMLAEGEGRREGVSSGGAEKGSPGGVRLCEFEVALDWKEERGGVLRAEEGENVFVINIFVLLNTFQFLGSKGIQTKK